MQGGIKEVDKIQDTGGLSQMPGGDFLEESRKSRIQDIKRIQESRIYWMPWGIQKIQDFLDAPGNPGNPEIRENP